MDENNDKLQVIARKRNALDLSSYTFGKIPPQAKDLEEAVLGACLLEKNAVVIALQVLRPEMFYVNAHQLVFSSIIRLFGKAKPVDILTVTEDLKANGSLETAGGPFAITELTSRIASGANVEYHARIVKEKWLGREIIRISSESIKQAYEDTEDPLECLGNAVNAFATLLNDVAAGQSKSFTESVDKVFANIALAINRGEEQKHVVGLSTGNYMLDKKSLGYSAPNFVIVAGRNTDGKTSLASIEGPLQNAKNGIPVGIFTLEMSQDEIIQKMAARESGVDVDKIRSGRLTADEQHLLSQSQELIRNLPIQIYDKGGLAMPELSAVAKGWKAKYGTKYFVIDYLQLLKLGILHRYTREQEISEISRSLKSLAKELDSPVIAIAALSRNLESRSGWDRRPKDSDLREGGSLEYDADIIVYVFRPENHNLEKFDDGTSTKNAIELIISKNKLGLRGIVKQSVHNGTGRLTDFVDYKTLDLPTPVTPLKSYTDPTTTDDDVPF